NPRTPPRDRDRLDVRRQIEKLEVREALGSSGREVDARAKSESPHERRGKRRRAGPAGGELDEGGVRRVDVERRELGGQIEAARREESVAGGKLVSENGLALGNAASAHDLEMKRVGKPKLLGKQEVADGDVGASTRDASDVDRCLAR